MTTAMNTIGILLILNFSGGSRYKVYVKEILYFGNPINSKFTRMSTWYPSTHAKTKLWKTDFFFFFIENQTHLLFYMSYMSFPFHDFTHCIVVVVVVFFNLHSNRCNPKIWISHNQILQISTKFSFEPKNSSFVNCCLWISFSTMRLILKYQNYMVKYFYFISETSPLVTYIIIQHIITSNALLKNPNLLKNFKYYIWKFEYTCICISDIHKKSYNYTNIISFPNVKSLIADFWTVDKIFT